MQPSTTADDIFNEIVAVLQTVTDPADNAQLLFSNVNNTTNPLGKWEIYDGTQTTFQGTPAAVIIPADGPKSKFISNYENKRGYGYYIFIAMDTEIVNYFTTRKNMRLITDAILDAFDRSDMLNDKVDILEATTFKWIEEEATDGYNIIAPLEIDAYKTVQTAVA